MIYTVDNLSPQRIAKFDARYKVKIQVTGPQVIRFAPTKSELTIPPGNGAIDGIQVASANGIIEWEWCGEMWAIGSAPNSYFTMCVPGFRESTG